MILTSKTIITTILCLILFGSVETLEHGQEVVQMEQKGVVVGAPVRVQMGVVGADGDFRRIDGRLRELYFLDGFQVVLVQRQLVFGFNYDVVYRNKNNGKISFRIYTTFNKISILSKTITKIKTPTLPPTLPISPSTSTPSPSPPSSSPPPKTMSPAQYKSQQDFQNIDSKLRRESSQRLIGYELVQVEKQMGVDRNLYTVRYWNVGKGMEMNE